MSKKSFIPAQPSDMHTILARHKYRVRRKGGKVSPLLRWFSLKTWNALPAGLDEKGEAMPKQGWVKVDPEKFFVPPEAQEPEDEQDQTEVMSVEEMIEVRDAIMEGDGEDYTVAKLRDFVRAHDDVELDVSKFNKQELISEIQNQLINVA